MKEKRQFKYPNCPAAVTARYAEELRTKRSSKTGQPLTQSQLAWRSGVLFIRDYETKWHNAVTQKYGTSAKNNSPKQNNFMQHDFDDFDFDTLYDDLDNIKLTRK